MRIVALSWGISFLIAMAIVMKFSRAIDEEDDLNFVMLTNGLASFGTGFTLMGIFMPAL